ncbi:MAG: hypothetical protein VW700_06050 [Gammaproteobacteria bacterium]|jgi:hypothetical protein|tara:strand:- start:284 stop:490 length:207 start_codon:yes stop_codon:yes gene_type:complete
MIILIIAGVTIAICGTAIIAKMFALFFTLVAFIFSMALVLLTFVFTLIILLITLIGAIVSTFLGFLIF